MRQRLAARTVERRSHNQRGSGNYMSNKKNKNKNRSNNIYNFFTNQQPRDEQRNITNTGHQHTNEQHTTNNNNNSHLSSSSNNNNIITQSQEGYSLDLPTTITEHVDNVVEILDEPWGDQLHNKKAKCVRLAFRNIDHLPENRNAPKNAGIVKDIYDAELDIMGISEVNLAWQNVSQYDSLEKRFRENFQYSKFASSNNRLDSPVGTTHQVGGTIIGCIGNIACRIISIGKDDRQLGRWSYMTLRGNKGHKTHIVSIYRPVASTGATSAYQQQVAALAKTSSIYECPRDLFFTDLKALLSPWQTAGDTIIVGGDFNEDIRSAEINEFFESLLMREAILPRFDQQAPNTYDRGSKPIDGIFCSAGMEVQAGGYTEFEWGIGSTHRMIWVDIHERNFYNGSPPNLWQPIARKLNTTDPRIVQRYNDKKIQELNRTNIIPRMTQLYTTFQQTKQWTPSMAKEMNDIDASRLRSSLKAEKKCRRIKAGNVPWSPCIQESINRIRYYRACIKRYKYKKKINSRTLEKLRKKHKGPIALTILDAEIYLKEAFAKYKTDKPNANAIRYTYLADLANSKAAYTGKDGTNVLLELQHREEQRSLGRRLKSLKGEFKNSLSAVIAPNQDGAWVRYDDKEDIEKRLCEENIRRFTQANTSPCLDPAHVELFGEYGDSTFATDVLAGTADHNINLHPDLMRLLPFFKTPDPILNAPAIDLNISLDQYKKGWISQKEKTTSGGQMHFGHFKASAFNDTLANFDRMILETCLQTGHILPRWKHGTDIMIPKKSDSLRVDQLRTICLLPADWNFGNKLLSRRIMYQAERYNTIAPEQYGSRKNKSSVGHATNKSLLYDIQRQRKQDSALLILDAKACYDRIPIQLASLCLRRQGLPLSAIQYMMKPIKNMRHNVRTVFGESTISYRANEQQGYHGILQGNGAGPCIWVMLSTPILDHLRSEGHGIPTTTSEGEIRRTPAIGFVDDIDLTETITDLLLPLARPQASLTTWNQDLRAIAGALQSLKCAWQKLGFNFTSSNRWKLQKIDHLDQDLTFHNDEGIATLQRLEHNKATLALGIMFSVDGSMDDEVKYLKTKVIKWCDNLTRANLNRHETWYSVTAGILRTLNYPLLATTMNQDQITSIIAPLLNTALPRMGICRNMTREVIYCKQVHKGFGFPDLWDQQGILKLLEVLGRDHDTDTSLLIQESISMCQLESGLGPNFLHHKLSAKMEKVITNGFIKSLWQFCTAHDIKITFNKKDRVHTNFDLYLMQEWDNRVKETPRLQDLNACRLYLQVETLTEIIDLNGNAFRSCIWQGIKAAHDPKWPNQPRPSTSAWNCWRQWLAELVSCNTQGIFTHPMNIQYFDFHQWHWFSDAELSTLYNLQIDGTYLKYQLTNIEPVRRNAERHYFLTGISCDTLPRRFYPAHVIQQNQYRVQLDTFSRALSSTISINTTPIWSNYITKTTAGDTTLLQAATLRKESPLLLVCDGSFKSGYGSAAYVLTTEELFNQCSVLGTTRTTGGPTNQDSYRSELTGILAGLLHITQLVDESYFSTNNIHVKIVCDNKESMKVSLDHDLHPSISAKYNHYDLIHSIRSLQRDNIILTYQHVKGHQDDVIVIEELDLFEQLNVQMDTNCKQHRSLMEQLRQPKLWIAQLPNWKCRAETKDQLLCHNIEQAITTQISYDSMKNFMLRKQKIQSTEAFESIDWINLAKSVNSAKQGRRRWLAKHHVGMCGVNKWRKIWEDRDTDECPRCKQTENAHHVFLCKHQDVKNIWENELPKLKTWLEDYNTDPDITKTIISCLRQLYFNDNDPLIPHHILQQQQSSIGYINFFEGELHREWGIQQELYWGRHDIELSGDTWTKQLITYLWDLRYKFWDERNNVEHAQDNEAYINLLNTDIEIEITTGFASLHPKYNAHISPAALLQLQESKNVEYKRSWLRNIIAARTQPNIHPTPRERANRLDQSQRLITSYFSNVQT